MRLFRYALLIGSLFLASFVQAAPIPASMRQQDPRLEKPVSCVASHIYIGELVETFSKQSGVPITADEVGGASDVDVTVSLDHIPLADAMEALWSLVSYQNAEWGWERTGKASEYRYRLVQPEAARLLPNTLHDQVDKEFQAQVKKMLDALKMTPDQLKEAAKSDKLLASMAAGKDDRVRPSMEIFADLPSELQNSILQDHNGVSILVSQLSPEGRKYVHENWLAVRDRGGLTKDESGNLIPVREPQSIIIMGAYNDVKMAPSLNIDTGFGCGDLAGGGWMEKEWRNKVSLMWMRPGDLRDVPAAAKQIPTPRATSAAPSKHTFDQRLMQLARAASIPLLARLPDEREGSTSITDTPPYNQTVGTYLTHLQSSLEHKWRSGVLLLSYSPRLTDPAKQTDAPWSVVRQLRESEAKGDGYLTLADYARAAHALTPQQMQALSAHFPSMPNAGFWRDVLAIYDGSPSIRPALMSPTGCDYMGVLHAAATALGPQAEKLVQDGTATHVRIEEKRHDEWKPAAKEIAILLLSNKGKILAGQGFTYQSHQWMSSVEAEKVISRAKD